MEQTDIETIKTWLGTGAINIFGLPFSGKDTHSNRLANLFDAPILGGGDILRNSDIPERVRDIMNSGVLIPTEDYISIVTPYLASAEYLGKPLILSSVGRWKGEEAGILSAAEAAGHPIKAVIYLLLDEPTAHQRFLKSLEDKDRDNRHDDSAEILAVRFDEFRNKTLPVIDHYRNLGLLTEIDGIPPKDEVTTAILQALLQRANQQVV